jgi:hypothetical protein
MGVLLMLLTFAGLVCAAVALLVSLVTRTPWLARFTVAATAVWFAFYALMLFSYSLTSREETFAVGEAKQFCGLYLDCHMHAAVTGVRTARKIGGAEAHGLYYIVGVRVFSNARNDAVTLRLLQPETLIRDRVGRIYRRDETVEDLLPSALVDLSSEITSSQTIEKELVFDLPLDVQDPRLDISEGYGIDKIIETILVGDEDSVFHKRTYFRLQEQTPVLSSAR